MTASKEPSKGGIDWQAIKFEFVNGSMSLSDLAKSHGLNGVTVRSRAMREDWQLLRNELQHDATKKATELITIEKVDKLKELNETDLSAAQLLRDKAESMLNQVETPNELKALASVYDLAQKISRLALGASTENSTVTTKELPVSVDEFV